ncbi:IDEAL domain-containing protein [Lederbergia lenta]|uniref:Uncharacterized conserved protein n=1 Tax=Lederbergia lenta TaxID=1467 RepID=A0A2X4WE06_LEDLE|nr:IDEAL domain-containing protein [Lederbergia lenta]MCM3110488.1 IDEAL domain-containing protein [Lederbergia lenta]MEC2323946.1 IDEAL domain-containing protein [Lederbergia lenta]SQI60979.1 Uncharacterized conserved protein [Lederbergia lenta]
MEKKKSYQELLKEYTMTQIQKETREIESKIDQFLNGLLQKRHVEQLRTEIDQALDQKDEKSFHKLAQKLSSILKNS